MSPRRRKIARNIAIGLLAVPVILGVTVRLVRHRSGAPDVSTPGLVRVRNVFTDLYGVRVGDSLAIFDGGIDGDGATIDKIIGALGGGGRDAVTDVFLTHGHFDHVSESPLCKRARVHVGRADVDMLAGRAPAEPAGARWMSIIAPPPAFEANAPLDGPTTIALGEGKEVLALPLPGHTRGSYVYYYEGILIAGDSLQIDGDHLDFAIGVVSVDMDANRRAVAGLRDALKGKAVHTVCTGHQGCTPPGRGAAMLDALITRAAAP